MDRHGRAVRLAGAGDGEALGAVHTAMQDKAVGDNLVSGGSEIVASKPEEFRKVMERDYAKYGKLSDLFKTVK